MTDNYILDTNIIIDFQSAEILSYLNCNLFFVSNVVYTEEISKQIKSDSYHQLNLINECYEELVDAKNYSESNKRISFYDALNLSIAINRKMILVTGDQQLMKCALSLGVKCIGTIGFIEILLKKNLLNVKESIQALKNLKMDLTRRIPHQLIDSLIQKLESSEVLVK